jgi:hypothetical protein
MTIRAVTRSIARLCSVACFLAAIVTCQAQTSTGSNAITLAGLGYSEPHALSVAPGQLITLHVYGLAVPTTTMVTATPSSTGYPATLNGISVDLVQGSPAATTSLGIHALYQDLCEPVGACSPLTGVTLQIPFELEANFGAEGDPPPVLRVSQNGAVAGGIALLPVSDAVHVLNTCDDTQVYFSAAYSVPSDICAPAVMVNQQLNSLYNLAHGGEELAMWLYGLGAVTQASQAAPLPVAQFQLNYDFRPNAPASPAVPGFGLTSSPVYVGYENLTYQLNFVLPPVPAGVPACDGVKILSNVTVTVSGPNSYDAAQLCVAPN